MEEYELLDLEKKLRWQQRLLDEVIRSRFLRASEWAGQTVREIDTDSFPFFIVSEQGRFFAMEMSHYEGDYQLEECQDVDWKFLRKHGVLSYDEVHVVRDLEIACEAGRKDRELAKKKAEALRMVQEDPELRKQVVDTEQGTKPDA